MLSMTYISILRGINVSGKNMLKMDALKKMCVDLQMENVQTYIQSGNIIFNYIQTNTTTITEWLQSNIVKHFGLEVPVITLTKDELENIVTSNPFTKDATSDPVFLHVSFLSEKPEKANIASLQQTISNNDKHIVINKAVYLYCPNGYGKSKLINNYLERKLKVICTTRNWKTTLTLLEMAGKIS